MANTGDLTIRATEELDDLIMDSLIPASNFEVDIEVNGNQVQEHIVSDSSYKNKILSLELSNKINTVLNNTKYTYPLQETSTTLYALLIDIFTNAGFTSDDWSYMWGDLYSPTQTIFENK